VARRYTDSAIPALITGIELNRSVLPKPFSTATQFLERQSIATHTALLDKKGSFKKKKSIY
jgi:hypothetical protein